MFGVGVGIVSVFKVTSPEFIKVVPEGTSVWILKFTLNSTLPPGVLLASLRVAIT